MRRICPPICLLIGVTASLLALCGEAVFFAGVDVAASGRSGQNEPQAVDKLIYADFEESQDGRPVSSRGGLVQLIAYQESPTRPSRFKGAAQASPPAPELVKLQKDNPNKAAAFDYELQSPNQYAGVGMEVHGQADRGGKPVADDVSGYKYLSLQVYATGVPSLRLEIVSQGQGIKMATGWPQMSFRVKPGFNTYRVPLNSLAQLSWAEVRVSPKEVLKKLTSINLFAYCDECTPVKGTVVVDNVVFEK